MTQSRRFNSIIFFLVLLLMLYLAAQIVRAQEVFIPSEPMLPTDAPIIALVPTDEPVLDEVIDLLLISPPTEPMLPTDAPIIALVPTDEPTLDGEGVSDPSITLIPPEPTTIPTDMPIETLIVTGEPTVAFILANIVIVPSITGLSEDTVLTLTVSAEGLSDIYNVGVACRVDPIVLQGVQAAGGDMFLTDLSTATDSGFQPDGLWILIGNQLDSAPPLASAGALWTFNYRVVGTGITEIVCQTRIGDRNNEALPLIDPNPVLTIDASLEVIEIASPTPLATETEVPIIPVATEVIAEIPTDIPVVSTLISWVHVYGRVESVLPLTQASITISGSTMNQIIAVQPNGSFGFDMPVGEYQLSFNAFHCLPEVLSVMLADEPMKLPTVTLIGGDVDGNYMIDMADVMLITQNFGLASHLTSASADLNEDGIVNIYDLALVSASIHLSQ